MSAAQSLHRFQAKSALQPRREPPRSTRIDLTLPPGGQSCAGKSATVITITGVTHDPRAIDLIAIVALLFVIIAVFRFYNNSFSTPPRTSAFIVPSQSVHW